MAEDELKCLLCLFLGCVINLLSLPITMPFYLAYRGKWLDLTFGIPRVWAQGLKL
jgi:hypothetical protein